MKKPKAEQRPDRVDEVLVRLAATNDAVVALGAAVASLSVEANKNRLVVVRAMRNFNERTDWVLERSNTNHLAAKKMAEMFSGYVEQSQRIEDVLATAVGNMSGYMNGVGDVRRMAGKNTDRVDELATAVALLVEELQEIRKGEKNGEADLSPRA